ncbi:hypothetical protein FGB62_98g045 [Gracilaria domingensis]|nr:hypothetical protein FGB62_98g045 [Gracilaria domingensis]
MAKAIKSPTRFCVSGTHERFDSDIRDLSHIASWFQQVDRGVAVCPCKDNTCSGKAQPPPQGGLDRLKRLASFGALCKEGRLLMTHFRRAHAAAAELVGSLEPSSLSLDDAVSSEILHVSTWCEACEPGCRGCLAKAVHRRVRRLRNTFTSFKETLSAAIMEVRELVIDDALEEALEEQRSNRKRKRPSEWEQAQERASQRRAIG